MDILKTINNNAIIIELFTAIAAVTIAVATLIMMHKHKKESDRIYLASLITDYVSTAKILYRMDFGYLLPLKESGYNPNFINIFSQDANRMPLIITINKYFILFEILYKKDKSITKERYDLIVKINEYVDKISLSYNSAVNNSPNMQSDVENGLIACVEQKEYIRKLIESMN